MGKRSEIRRGKRQKSAKLRRQIDEILARLNALGQERLDLGDEFLEGVDVTDIMYAQLEAGKYPDKEFQEKWVRFQKIQREMTDLKNKGGDLAVENRKLINFSDYLKLLLKFDRKQQNNEQVR